MEDGKKDCKLCGQVSGLFGLLLGAFILFVSVDVLTNGKLSTMISGGTPVDGEDDDSDDA